MVFMAPDTLACTGDDTAPTASPINCPTFTWSPVLTMGFAGVPECMDIGSFTSAGIGSGSGIHPAVFFMWGAFTTPSFLIIKASPLS